jgi:hypothetical protein
MESPDKQQYRQPESGRDLDLGYFLTATGRKLSSFFRSVGNGLDSLGEGVLALLFFIRKHIIWLLLGTVVGLGYGIYQHTQTGFRYTASMTVKTNFNSSRALYNVIDYLNALVSNGNTTQLASIFGISKQEAGQLMHFSADHIESEMITAEMYRQKFLEFRRNERVRQDTFWSRTVKYTDFKRSLTGFDFPLHEVTLISTNPVIFPRVQNGVISLASSNKFLQQLKNSAQTTYKEEESLLIGSLESLDSLRASYTQRIQKTPIPGGAGTSVTVTEQTQGAQTPELQLYDKMLELKDELRDTRTSAVTESEIIEIIAPFNGVGTRVGFLRQTISRFAITGFLIALLIIVGVLLYKSIGNLEVSYRKKVNGRPSA